MRARAIRLIMVFFLTCGLLVGGAGGASGGGYRFLEKEVVLTKPLLVKRGETLYVAPGTRIRVDIPKSPEAEDAIKALTVQGRLIIDGREERPVLITGGAGWGEIFLEDAEAVVRHARVEKAAWAFHIHGGFILIEKSDISENEGGIRTYREGMYFKESRLAGNGVAIRYWEGGPVVRECAIYGNRVGLFFREGASTALFRDNLIDNREYNLKIGDFASGIPDVRENYWGTADEGQIGAKVFDGRERSITVRDIYPVLEYPPRSFPENNRVR